MQNRDYQASRTDGVLDTRLPEFHRLPGESERKPTQAVPSHPLFHKLSQSGRSAISCLFEGRELSNRDVDGVLTYALALSDQIRMEKRERDELQNQVDIACLGLEKECGTLRAEVTNAMKMNRELQGLLDEERSRRKTGQPGLDVSGELRRVTKELERVSAERHQADQQLHDANAEIGRLQRMYTAEVERASSSQGKQLRELEVCFAEATAAAQLRYAEVKQREMKSEERVKELEGELEDAVRELEVSRANASSLLKSLEQESRLLVEARHKLHNDTIHLSQRLGEADGEALRLKSEVKERRREVDSVEESHKRQVGSLSRDLAKAQAAFEREKMRADTLEERAAHSAHQLQDQDSLVVKFYVARRSCLRFTHDGGRQEMREASMTLLDTVKGLKHSLNDEEARGSLQRKFLQENERQLAREAQEVQRLLGMVTHRTRRLEEARERAQQRQSLNNSQTPNIAAAAAVRDPGNLIFLGLAAV